MLPTIEHSPETVARIREGDVAAFESLYRAMHQPLRTFATRYLGDTGRAEELVQDLFFDIWKSRAEWQVAGSVRSYLFSAVRNRALNMCRRETVERDWADDEAGDSVRALHPAPPRPDTELERAELSAQLTRALASLPERCALVMHLRWQDTMSYADIAQVLGISVKGVEVQLARGLRYLRNRIGAP
ncbi:MAG: RNA polymerase sigma-70 factor [bacterium]